LTVGMEERRVYESCIHIAVMVVFILDVRDESSPFSARMVISMSTAVVLRFNLDQEVAIHEDRSVEQQ